jgi:hypothetical protein
MKTFNFTSALSNEMAHFVKLKQSLGSDYYHNAQLLYRFDQYLDSVSFDDTILTLPIFQHYFETINHLCHRGFANHYCVLRQFSCWLNQYITSTQVYLEATSELLQAGCERFYTFFLKHNKGDNK